MFSAIFALGPIARWYHVQRHTRGKRRSRPPQLPCQVADEPLLHFGNEALPAINELIFRTVVQQVDMLGNCSRRRIVLWLDEARLAGPLLRRDLLPYFPYS